MFFETISAWQGPWGEVISHLTASKAPCDLSENLPVHAAIRVPHGDLAANYRVAERNPDAFKCNPSPDGFQRVNMNGEIIKIREEDYLAIRSGGL